MAMTKRPVTYTNFDGEEVTEDLYFNLTKAELTFMQTNNPEAMSKILKKIVDEKDIMKIFAQISNIVCMAYGDRSVDQKTGKTRFYKTPELVEEFRASEAHSELMFGLMSNVEECVTFIKSIMPAGLNADTAPNSGLTVIEGSAREI